MSSYGVLATGFNKKPLSVIITEIEADLKATINPNLNTTPTSVVGQQLGVFAASVAENWDVLQGVYSAQYPDSAGGASLDAVAAITGALRLAATKSALNLTCTGDDGVILAIGRQARVPNGGIFQTTAPATISLATTWAPTTAYSLGDVRSSDDPLNIYVVTVAGTSAAALSTSANTENFTLVDGQTLTVKVDGAAAQTVTFNTADFGDIANATALEVAAVITTDLSSPAATGADSGGAVTIVSDSGGQIEVTGGTANAVLGFPTTIFGGPIGEGSVIIDGGVTWRFLGNGEAFVDVASESTVTGPVVGQAFTVSEIVTPVSNWQNVINQIDATLGENIEIDAAFRLRREALIRVTGKATLEAVRAAVLQVSGVSEAIVFENTSLVTVGGIPGKAFETVVLGGTDVDVAQSIFDTKPLGIQPFGTDISELIVDSKGNSHTIEASRADLIEMFADCTLTVDGTFPADGIAQVEAAIKAQGDLLLIGEDVIFKLLECSPFDVQGVVDIPTFVMDKRPVTVVSANSETFVLVDGQTLTVKVDGQSTVFTATFNTADFGNIALATAAEVAAVITTDVAGATASDASGFVDITSDSGGTIEVTGGTANGVLGFPASFTPTGGANVAITSRQRAVWDTVRINAVVV